jgi:RNA polymerase subunit RPABC4/transcription elongation factor Spt4
MIEYLNCDACTAVVSTEMTLCEYCGNDFKNSGSSGEIIRLKNEIEKKIYKADISSSEYFFVCLYLFLLVN